MFCSRPGDQCCCFWTTSWADEVVGIIWQVRSLEMVVDERELKDEIGLEDRGSGHLFQGEDSDVVRDTWSW